MEKIGRWLKKNGFGLQISKSSTDCVVFGNSKRVFLNAEQSKKSILSAALHECGHILVFKSRLKNKKKRVAGISWNNLEREKERYAKNTKRRKMAILTEEVEAWDRGWKLARRLGIRFTKHYYENQRIRCLMTYARWLAHVS